MNYCAVNFNLIFWFNWYGRQTRRKTHIFRIINWRILLPPSSSFPMEFGWHRLGLMKMVSCPLTQSSPVWLRYYQHQPEVNSKWIIYIFSETFFFLLLLPPFFLSLSLFSIVCPSVRLSVCVHIQFSISHNEISRAIGGINNSSSSGSSTSGAGGGQLGSEQQQQQQQSI